MKNNIFLFCAGLLLAYGCGKQLNALPQQALVSGNAITSQQNANTALNGVYYLFANATATQTNWINNETYGAILTGYMGYGGGDIPEENNQLGNTNFTSEWSRYYNLVNGANGVIDGVTPLDSNLFTNGRKQQILAEARFMRAYGHMKLLLWFGQWNDIDSKYGIILRDQFITSDNILKARTTVRDSYSFIQADIDAAIAGASTTGSNVYVNRWSAMALKMRMLLSRGQNDDYARCAALGDSIINNGPYALENNTKDIFYAKGLTSSEVMLGIQPQPNQGALGRNVTGNFAPVRGVNFYVATNALKTLLAGDPRLSWIVGGDGRYGKGYYFIKYITGNLTPSQLSEVAYAFRLTEIYLMEAEALVRAGSNIPKARSLLKIVMTRAGVTDFSAVDNATSNSALLVQLYLEYARNLLAEDEQEYFALLRLPLATVTQLRPTITSTQQYILPIPPDEFQHNPLLGDQNPGYAK